MKYFILHINVKSQLLAKDMRRTKLRSFRFVVDNANLFVGDRLIRHRVLNEIAAYEFTDVPSGLLRDAHQRFLFFVREQHIADHIVPVIMPGSQLAHDSFTITFP